MQAGQSDKSEFLNWKLCDAVHLHEAALLMWGILPEGGNVYIIPNWEEHKWPKGLLPIVTFLKAALLQEKIEGNLVLQEDHHGNRLEGQVDIINSLIDVASLSAWLRKRRVVDAFFNDSEAPQADYLDSNHPHFAPKLAAAVMAWQEVALAPATGQEKGTPKQRIEKWLRLNALKFGLSKEDGKFNEAGIEEIAKVANWQPQGGAAQTPVKAEVAPLEPEDTLHLTRVDVTRLPPVKPKIIKDDEPFDSEIPF